MTENSLLAEKTAGKVSNYKVIIAASLGNGLEIFDFTVYSFFAVIIGKLYFPSDSVYGSLLLSFAVFGAGFITRPLGSMVLGTYADKKGRKAAMLVTIILMGLGTSFIAFSPTHAQIGILAPLLILAGRLIQGFAAGGEVGAATTLLLESAGKNQRGFFVSFQGMSQGVSILAGASFGLILTSTLSEEALYSWGWRIPFIFGMLIIPVGLYIRKNINETYSSEAKGNIETQKNKGPLLELLSHHPRELVLGILMIMSGTTMSYIIMSYMPTYMIRTSLISAPTAYLFSCIAGITQVIAIYYSGRYVDKVNNYKKPMLFSMATALLLVYPMFWFLGVAEYILVAAIFRILIVVALGINILSSVMLIVAAFPKHVRATGTSVVYSFGVAIFGGSAQFLVTWMLDITGNPMAPAWYLIIMLSLSLLATCMFKERHYD
ncbi:MULTISPECIES: MFS transporter [unclassified Serratia (in: enterobacteria)]|uniref:MFS transporter n=1 Tax=unclassified Serratia (in: enterobacteria) TaxID=2647522 RepID=UPI0030767472